MNTNELMINDIVLATEYLIDENTDEGLTIYHNDTWRSLDEFIEKLKKTF